ncbi:SAM-dependent chlorinase/fluorinase [Spongiactinospora sp. TRM90649]|uniref:SAM hydrolase/SAM-dependent halogenase family protein n=1 Tax=Spongiactinospora sp. TRM90649 TaxID=3031114 RepID=UPI0023F73486|nr:SAM-dependent chlorinase/fluorinase [Spongiactinospora sp. TRM90649]MDF5756130.1 SAM-dependent chlorinase/fluorinase [Spongiactinospora sp. TRM90649]
MFVSLSTDFGASSTAICAGVVHSIAPRATVLVLSDEIGQYRIVEGAMLLRRALPYLPVGVHMGIVDPGVGTSRRPVAVETVRGDVLVGPDNGLLVPAAELLGGIATVHRLDNPDYRLPRVSGTFHGRDVFAPAAAHIALGADLDTLGVELAADDLVTLDIPAPQVGEGELVLPVLYTDEFGSLVLGGERADLSAALGLRELAGTRVVVAWTGPDGEPRTVAVPFEHTYGAVPAGQPLCYEDSSGWLGVAVNQGSAARRLGIAPGDVITLRADQG